MTVGVSFGAERDAAFEHARNRCVVSMPQVISLTHTVLKLINSKLSILQSIKQCNSFFSQMARFTLLDETSTYYGGTAYHNWLRPCNIRTEEYQSYVGDG